MALNYLLIVQMVLYPDRTCTCSCRLHGAGMDA